MKKTEIAQRRVTDEQARRIIEKHSGCHTVSEFERLNVATRNTRKPLYYKGKRCNREPSPVFIGGEIWRSSMRKFICCIIAICTLLSAAGCQYALDRKKNQYYEIYQDEGNYFAFTGEITEFVTNVGYVGQLVKIDCGDLLDHISDEEYKHIYFSISSDLPLDLDIGDTIVFVTVPKNIQFSYCLPIVAVEKDGETLLALEVGKQNLFDWVEQLQLK